MNENVYKALKSLRFWRSWGRVVIYFNALRFL